MIFVECILLFMLVLTAVSALFQKRTLISVIVFVVFGLVMSVIWMLLQAPDLAITEAAVGSGVTGLLFYLTLKRCHQMGGSRDEK